MAGTKAYDDWSDEFQKWQNKIGLPGSVTRACRLETKFGELHSEEIEFGDYAGRRKWNGVAEIHNQRTRDALERLIVVQGDPERASAEQHQPRTP